MGAGRYVAGIGTAVMLLTAVGIPVGTAAAAPKPPTVVARNTQPTGPQLLVDSKGTVDIVWMGVKQTNSGGENVVHFARKTKSSKKFVSSKLPKGAVNVGDPFLFEASPGVLVIAVEYNDADIIGYRSTNDGKTWAFMNTTAINNRSDGTYLYTNQMRYAPGGPIDYAGSDFAPGPIEQFNLSLTAYHQVGTNDGSFGSSQLAMSKSGVLYQLSPGESATNKLPFEAGSHLGTVTFPACMTASNLGNGNLAAGASGAVVAETGCGHAWTRTISSSGVVGPLKLLGPAAIDASLSASPWVQVVADKAGHFTAVWDREGGDLAIAHSRTGSSWSSTTRSVPVAGTYAPYARNHVVSSGTSTWYAEAVQTQLCPCTNLVRAAPLSDTYKAPGTPSGSGISHPKHGKLGSLSVTVPGQVALKHFRKTGKLTVRVVGAMPDKLGVDVGDSRVKGNTTYDICAGAATAKITPGHARTVTVTCAGGGISVGVGGGGGSGGGIDVRKGDTVAFSFYCRNGLLTVESKVH